MHIKSLIAVIALTFAPCCTAQTTAPSKVPATAPLNRVEESVFGTMSDGAVIKMYTLANARGMQARVITLGGIIAGIKAPDHDGNLTNVVACADTLAETPRYAMSAQTIGRVANRIAGAKFTLDGQQYTTQANNGPNTLHCGDANFGTHVWQGEALAPKEHEGSARLTFISKDGDGGLPGTLTLRVTYTLTDDNEFQITYEATTDKATIINVTNHAYFNLNGAPGWGNTTASPGTNQEVWIDADRYLPTDRSLVPTGEFAPVAGTALDFTKLTVVGSRIAQLAPQRNYDHPFVLNSGGGKIALAARLRDPRSGREMEIRTDQPGLQLYTGQRLGVALETQHHPDSIHHDNFPSTILKPGETFRTTTLLTFLAK
jgi:aldose 1-epimerase